MRRECKYVTVVFYFIHDITKKLIILFIILKYLWSNLFFLFLIIIGIELKKNIFKQLMNTNQIITNPSQMNEPWE